MTTPALTVDGMLKISIENADGYALHVTRVYQEYDGSPTTIDEPADIGTDGSMKLKGDSNTGAKDI